jgi:uncharacterized membrane protein HdeD (DUF308 family)
MKSYLSGLRNALIIRGTLAVLFGLFALLMPGLTLHTFVLVFGMFAIVDGLISIISSFTKIKEEHNWWYLLMQGILSVLVGGLVLRAPFLTEILVVIYIAIWMIAIGALEIVTAVRLHKVIKGEGWYMASGIISILAGVIILYNPMGGLWALTWLIGFNAILFGLIFIVMGFRLGGIIKKMPNP